MAKIFWVNYGDSTLVVRDINPIDPSVAPKKTQLILMTNPPGSMMGDLSQPGGLFVDEVHSQVYWTNLVRNEVWTGKIDPKNPSTPSAPTLLMTAKDSNLFLPSGIFVDTTHKKIYWANHKNNSIWVGDIDPKNPSKPQNQILLMSGNNLKQPSGIHVDSTNNKIYWANYGNHSIWVGNITPSNPKNPENQFQLMSGGNVITPTGIFVDNKNNKLYWTNYDKSTLWVSNINPKNPVPPITNQKQLMGVSDAHLHGPFGLFIAGVTLPTSCSTSISEMKVLPHPIGAGQSFTLSWQVNMTGGQDQHSATINFNGETSVADYFNDGASRTLQAPNIAGNYPIALYVQDKEKPSCSDMKNIIVSVLEIKADAGPDREIAYGQKTQLGMGTPAQNVTYSWTPVTGLDSSDTLITNAAPLVTTTYTVTASSTEIPNFTATDSVTVMVCRLQLSDIVFTSNNKDAISVTGKQWGNREGIRFVDITYQDQSIHTPFEKNGTFIGSFTKMTIVDDAPITIKVYYSDNPGCFDEIKAFSHIQNIPTVNFVSKL